MPVSMTDLCADLAAETDVLRALVAPLPEPEWRRPTPAEGWSIADQVVHLAGADDTALLAATRPEEFRASLELPRPTVDEQVAEHRERAPSDVLGWFDASRCRVIDVFGDLGAHTRLPWFGPPVSAASTVRARIMETWAHARDVADALAVAPAPSDRLRHVAHVGVRTRTHSLRAHGEPDTGTDVRVELTGPGDTTWTWGPEDAPDRLRAPALDFCLLVTRRRHPDDLDLDVTGRTARRWVEVAQAYTGPPGPGRRPTT